MVYTLYTVYIYDVHIASIFFLLLLLFFWSINHRRALAVKVRRTSACLPFRGTFSAKIFAKFGSLNQRANFMNEKWKFWRWLCLLSLAHTEELPLVCSKFRQAAKKKVLKKLGALSRTKNTPCSRIQDDATEAAIISIGKMRMFWIYENIWREHKSRKQQCAFCSQR